MVEAEKAEPGAVLANDAAVVKAAARAGSEATASQESRAAETKTEAEVEAEAEAEEHSRSVLFFLSFPAIMLFHLVNPDHYYHHQFHLAK